MAVKNGKIWTSELVKLEIEKKNAGAEYDSAPFYAGDTELRRADLNFIMTPEETDEYRRCVQYPIYFVEKYCNFLTDYGRKPVVLRDYQKNILEVYSKRYYDNEKKTVIPCNRNIICMASRQTGKTTTTVSFLAHYLISNTDRNILVMANKMDTSKEIVNKLSDVFKGLPFFLKPGVRSWGAKSFKLDNDCLLMSQATTKTASIGFTIHVLYMDEVAHVPPNIIDNLWRSVYPTLSSSALSQCIISSTPNGMTNKFYQLWSGAIEKRNSFVPIRVDYWEVPGHDEEWAAGQRADLGDDEFEQEFALSFNVSSKTFVPTNILHFANRIKTEYVRYELNTRLEEDDYFDLTWDPRFDFEGHRFNDPSTGFILSIDVAEGKAKEEVKDNDSNVINIFAANLISVSKMRKLKPNDRTLSNIFRLTQVGVYSSNVNDEEHMAKVARAVVFDTLGPDCCKLLLEMNFNGKVVLKCLTEDPNYEDSVIVKTHHTKPIEGEKRQYMKAGYKTNKNKEYVCKQTRKMMIAKKLIMTHPNTIKELSTFGEHKGTLQGIGTHDDLSWSTMAISHFTTHEEYESWLSDIFENLPESPEKDFARMVLDSYDETEAFNDSLDLLGAYKENDLFDYREMQKHNDLLHPTDNFLGNASNYYAQFKTDDDYNYKPSTSF